MDIAEYFKTYWYIAAAIVIVIIGSIVYSVVRTKKQKESNTLFLAEHPAAAKVYLTKRALAVSGTVQVLTVNGQHAQLFTESGKSGFYVVPGQGSVYASFSTTRPGVVYRTVTKTWGPANFEFVTAPNKSYFLGFNSKESAFTFEETE
jgi:hypothetical protein